MGIEPTIIALRSYHWVPAPRRPHLSIVCMACSFCYIFFWLNKRRQMFQLQFATKKMLNCRFLRKNNNLLNKLYLKINDCMYFYFSIFFTYSYYIFTKIFFTFSLIFMIKKYKYTQNWLLYTRKFANILATSSFTLLQDRWCRTSIFLNVSRRPPVKKLIDASKTQTPA